MGSDTTMKFMLEFAAKTAGLKDSAELAGKLAGELEGAEDAGKQMAAALKAAADKAQKELDDTIAMADELGRALGPELTARVNVDEIAAKMQTAGVSIEDVKANADDFRASLGQMADTADQAKARMGDLDTSVQRVGDTADKSRSVMANFTGNAIQELPGVASAFGPVSMAAGQFAEYAAEGDISLGGMAKMIGPMAGLGIVVGVVASHMEQVAKSKAFHKDRVEEFTKALQDGATAAEAWDAALTGDDAAKKLEWVDPASGDIADLTHTLAENNITWEDFKTQLDKGTESFQAWALAIDGAHNNDANAIWNAGTQILEDHAAAVEKNAERTEVFGAAVERSLTPLADMYGKTRDLADGLAAAGRKWDELMGKFDTEDSVANAVLSLTGLKDELDAIAASSDTAVEKQAKATLAFNGTTESVIETVKQLGFLSPALAQQFEVLIESGQIDEAIRKLEWLTKVAEAMSKPGWFDAPKLPSTPGTMQAFASGTSNAPGGTALVGEKGPELVNLPAGSQVIPADRTAAMLAGNGPSAGEQAIINAIKASSAATARAVVQAMRAA